MTTTTLHITTGAPAAAVAPRGARWAAGAFVAAAQALQSWTAAWRSAPAMSTRAREAAALREHASSIARHDPRLAADLYAAADRHEQEA
jgi:hypothetical protein